LERRIPEIELDGSLRAEQMDYHASKRAINADKLSLIASFVAVAERLSFAEAAASQKLTASTISRKIARLEQLLEVRLLERTTRHVSLTEAGKVYLEQCNLILNRVTEADSMVASLSGEPRGMLRMSLPVAFGHRYVSAVIVDFLKTFQKMQVQADFTDRFVNIIDEGYDLAVRIGSLPDSGLIARRLAENRRLLVASKDYLAKHVAPEHPRDLAEHCCLCYSHYPVMGTVWRFRRGSDQEAISTSGALTSDSSRAVYDAVRGGLGVGLVAEYLCHNQLKSGELVPLLPEWENLHESGVYIVYPSQRYLSSKVRVFVDLMVQRFREPPWENG
jgi:DNA-binding transcriptional LysR family regulator